MPLRRIGEAPMLGVRTTEYTTMDNLVSAANLADLLDLHIETIRRLTANGSIPAYKIGGSWRYDVAQVRDALFVPAKKSPAVTGLQISN